MDDTHNRASETKTPREIIDLFNETLTQLGEAPGLNIGEKAPNFSLQNQYNQNVTLKDNLQNGPVILSFYRGEWCRHCNRELQQIEAIRDELKSRNVTVLGIAPQLIEYGIKMSEKNDLHFDLLSDPDFKVIDSYKLKFTLSEEVQDIYQNKFNLKLPELTANKSWELPIPATFIINQNGIIVERYVETDYTKRLTSEELLVLLNQM